ncbi:sulfatase [Aliifodinibius salicampi]|uniref:Sulfatase n=1 Tax=Fodinibius salicampi TaxID=1920655 RepID=A0ABT3PXY8_9BACT|nr:sulfatase [Fodinibius salicampi]MCW9712729.1 sulfatase [Fodinibius salicampi]
MDTFHLFSSVAKKILFLGLIVAWGVSGYAQDQRPNILFVISDDQSFPHASAYGSDFVETPVFDRVAEEGILFMNGFVASPGCSPSRATILTGRYPWQNEAAGTHASSFSEKYTVLPNLLEEAGYEVGYTGKGWGPGDWEVGGRDRNPAGPAFQDEVLDPPHDYIRDIDYAGNFRAFLEQRPVESPFYFWLGTSEPHRPYEKGIGRAAGKNIEDVEVPDYLPDTPEVRSDLLDYAIEIEWFDRHLGNAVTLLKERGELENTLIIVTSDNGMPFPRAKANLYEDGIHVPLAVRWGERVEGGRVVDDLVSLIDFMPTILEAAGVEHRGEYSMTGHSLMDILTSSEEGIVDPTRDAVYSGRERHSSSRWNNLGYPQRSLRTHQYLYIRNFAPHRWPAGSPRRIEGGKLTSMHSGYHDIDSAPTLQVMTEQADDPYFNRYLHLAVGRRPSEELYNIKKDPGCINNLALDPDYEKLTRSFRKQLTGVLRDTEDPRVVGDGDVWENYPRLRGPMRDFPPPEWALPLSED